MPGGPPDNRRQVERLLEVGPAGVLQRADAGDEEAGRDDRQRTEGRDASQVPERLERQGQYRHGGERPT